jgi:hypothetical protein
MVALTVVNAVMMTVILVKPQLTEAQAQPGILRGTGMQIVDQRGKPRATIELLPANPTAKMPDGSVGTTETVILRLIDSHGRPSVKIATADDGAGMSLTGAKGPAYMNVVVKDAGPVMKLVSDRGRENVLTP